MKMLTFTFQENYGNEKSSVPKVCTCSTAGVHMFNCDVLMHMETMRTVPGTFLMLYSVHAKRYRASIYKFTLLCCNVPEFSRIFSSLVENEVVEKVKK